MVAFRSVVKLIFFKWGWDWDQIKLMLQQINSLILELRDFSASLWPQTSSIVPLTVLSKSLIANWDYSYDAMPQLRWQPMKSHDSFGGCLSFLWYFFLNVDAFCTQKSMLFHFSLLLEKWYFTISNFITKQYFHAVTWLWLFTVCSSFESIFVYQSLFECFSLSLIWILQSCWIIHNNKQFSEINIP